MQDEVNAGQSMIHESVDTMAFRLTNTGPPVMILVPDFCPSGSLQGDHLKYDATYIDAHWLYELGEPAPSCSQLLV